MDITKNKFDLIFPKNKDVFKKVILEGEIFKFKTRDNKIIWNIIIPILTAFIAAVLAYLITNFWIK